MRTAGVGADRVDRSAAVDWSANTHNFEQLLAGALHQVSPSVLPSTSCLLRSSSGLNAEHAQPAGAAQARSKQPAAVAESESEEDKPIPEVRPKFRGRASGRYAKREAGKLVKGYSAQDLSQILGVASHTTHAAPPAFFVGTAEQAETAAAAPPPRHSAESKAAKRKLSTPKLEPAAPEAEVEEEELGQPPAAGWWGQGWLVWAGRLGSSRELASRKRGFDEDEQERIATEALDQKMTNRQGLGVKTQPKKVAGARWAGKKTSLGAGDEDDDDPGVGDGAKQKGPKWKKLAERALTAAGGSLKVAKLKAAVLAEAGATGDPEAEAALMRRLELSSRFQVSAKRVKLVVTGETS